MHEGNHSQNKLIGESVNFSTVTEIMECLYDPLTMPKMTRINDLANLETIVSEEVNATDDDAREVTPSVTCDLIYHFFFQHNHHLCWMR